MINKQLRKNTYFALACFVFTLLPLGIYNTFSGKIAFIYSAELIFATAFFYKLVVDYHNSSFVNKMLSKYKNKLTSILFSSNEQKFCMGVFFIPIVTSLIVGYFVFNNLPVTSDSIAQYDHAKLLAQGMFSIPAHPFPDFFPLFGVIDTGERWYSQYQLGHLLPLALGHLLGIVWLVNPLMCGLSALLLYFIAYDNYRKNTARLTGFLTIFCAQWIYMASEYMNHNTTLLGCLLFVWGWLRLLKTFEIKYSALAGLGFGLALITRPITTIAVVLPFGVYGLYKILQEPAKRWFVIAPAVILTLAFGAWQLYFNLQTTGDFWVFGPEKLYGNQVKYGFGEVLTTDAFGTFYKGSVHTLWRGIGDLSNNLIGLNSRLFGWPLPSLLLVFCGWMVFRVSVVSKLMFMSFVFLSVVYIPYFFNDLYYGARYLHEATGFLIIATALGIERIPAILRILNVQVKYSKIIGIIGGILSFTLVLGSGLFFVSPYMSMDRSYFDINITAVDKNFSDNSLVFVNKHYKQFRVFMPPLESNRVIYAKDLGDENKKLIDYYPLRKVFLETEDGFKIIK